MKKAASILVVISSFIFAFYLLSDSGAEDSPEIKYLLMSQMGKKVEVLFRYSGVQGGIEKAVFQGIFTVKKRNGESYSVVFSQAQLEKENNLGSRSDKSSGTARFLTPIPDNAFQTGDTIILGMCLRDEMGRTSNLVEDETTWEKMIEI